MIWAGMQLTEKECRAAAVSSVSLAQATQVAGLQQNGRRWVCQRCGERQLRALPAGGQYCPSCVGLDRITSETTLVRFAAPPIAWRGQMSWQGELTPAQQAAQRGVLASVAAGRDHLLHAVTGAGKTEMLFAVVAAVLRQGRRVAWATPRVDVVRELAPRLASAFQGTPLVARYGGAPWPSVDAQLVVLTTHQLLRYHQAFGLIIVDEVDAFPYPQTPMLAYGVRQAASGPVVFLTATPGEALQRAARRGQIGVSRLLTRFHGAPLPVPRPLIRRGRRWPHRLDKVIVRRLTLLKNADSKLLLFVPQIDWLKPLVRQLVALGWQAAGVHASDPEREAKVLAFRQGQLDCLVTTTILERGVTIPHCAVLVLGADSPLFSAAGLIQMAGRAGRSADFPADPVYFVARHWTADQLRAIATIRRTNRGRA